jgi:amidase
VEFLRHFASVVTAHTSVALEEIGRLLGRILTQNDVEPWTWANAERGRKCSANQYITALNWLQTWSRRVAQWWVNGFDLAHANDGHLYRFWEVSRNGETVRIVINVYGLMQFTPQYNITGQPAISLPLHWNAAGLPIGIRWLDLWICEDLLIQVASQLEQATKAMEG